MTNYAYANGELYHFGIKGMKWGVRRFQKKDGSLTPAGKKRYDDTSKTKTTHRQRLEEKYRSQGMTGKQAKEAADKRIRTEKIVATTAALTLAAATAYVINKNVKERADGLIKSGTTLQRITADPTINMDRAMYTSYDKSDMTKYKGMYGMQIKGAGGQVKKVSLNASKDIKIVSRDKASEVFADLYKNDSEFRKSFEKTNGKMQMLGARTFKQMNIHNTAAGKMTDKQLKRAGYDAFNRSLALHDNDSNATAQKFYDRLKTMGYDAVMDINDQKYSGYKAKKPVILFNAKNSVSVSKMEDMADDQIMSNFKKAYTKIVAPKVVALGTAYAGSSYAMRKLNERALVQEYKRQHPNTKKTDKEIAELLA